MVSLAIHRSLAIAAAQRLQPEPPRERTADGMMHMVEATSTLLTGDSLNANLREAAPTSRRARAAGDAPLAWLLGLNGKADGWQIGLSQQQDSGSR